MNKKIVVIGAGVGGCYVAELLGKMGNDVTVYEIAKRGEVSYDWHDDINPSVFDKVGITLPEEKFWFRKNNWTFVSPSEETAIAINLPEEKLDFSIERRKFAEFLISRAEKYANFVFGTTVEKLIVKDEQVVGIVVNGEEIYADLVIDNSGVNSPFRAMAPASYGMTDMYESEEVFRTFRAFYNRNESAPEPTHMNAVYLKHLGEKGISWCIKDPSGMVNVLVGRIGELSEETLENALNKLKASNPIIGDKILRGGGIYDVSVRYPALRMAGKGYVTIGDSAFQTIPMLGSGLEMSLLAAYFLAENVKKFNSIDMDALWGYQVDYFKAQGADHISVDMLKRFLLAVNPNDIDYLFKSGVVSNSDFEAAAVGGTIKLGIIDLITRVYRGRKKIGLLLTLKTALDKGERLKKTALTIPTVYDEQAIEKWVNKMTKIIKK